MGGRATGRVTLQTRDVVVEGLTLAYLGMNLLGKKLKHNSVCVSEGTRIVVVLAFNFSFKFRSHNTEATSGSRLRSYRQVCCSVQCGVGAQTSAVQRDEYPPLACC
jgi:hypothetical protein